MKSYRFLPLLLSGVFLSGCLMTRSQIREKQDQNQSVAQSKAQEQARYIDLEEQLRNLRGRIDELDHGQSTMRNDRQSIDQQRSSDRQALEQRLKIYEETLSRLESQYLNLAQKVEALAADNVAPRKSSSAPASKNTFETAESLFDKKNWKEAIVEYQKYRDKNPKGRNYSESTYKIGVCFQELGMKDEAKSFYAEVVEKYPKSKSADKAKYRLKQIK